jgi:hypothetical protein
MTSESKWPKVGLLLLVAVCLACAAACGSKDEGKTGDAGKDEPAAKADGKPKIVAVEGKHEFGKVKQGVDVEHVFKIKNEGDADLKIEKARGS